MSGRRERGGGGGGGGGGNAAIPFYIKDNYTGNSQ